MEWESERKGEREGERLSKYQFKALCKSLQAPFIIMWALSKVELWALQLPREASQLANRRKRPD